MEFAGDLAGHEEEIIDRGIAFEKKLFVAVLTIRFRGEIKLASVTFVESPIKDQAVAHFGLRQISKGLVNAEHVFAKGAAVTAMTDPVRLEDELVARREKPQLIVAGLKEVATVGVRGGRHCKILDGIIEMPVQSYFLVLLRHNLMALALSATAASESARHRRIQRPRAARRSAGDNQCHVSGASAGSSAPAAAGRPQLPH